MGCLLLANLNASFVEDKVYFLLCHSPNIHQPVISLTSKVCYLKGLLSVTDGDEVALILCAICEVC